MPTPDVELRKMPYPYRAMLAICSDLDETPDWHTYREIMRFCNTHQDTAVGPGVGLEIGNSIYFDMPPHEFAYWNTTDAGRALVQALIRSGHIDCLHSYGDLATSRRHAGVALEELARHDCRLAVWIDHRVAPTNFGADIMHGAGDVPGSPAYHADLSCDFGIRYVWRGRVTSIIGQDTPPRLNGILTHHHLLPSAKTLAKEAIKGALARCGHGKYGMHSPNDVLRATRLRSRQPVYEFVRSNPFWGGVENADTARGIAATLTTDMLSRLIAREGVCIFYTHLGKGLPPGARFDPTTVAAFQRLADRFLRGEILVTTTRRLLGYRRATREVSFCTQQTAIGLQIEIHTGRAASSHNGALSMTDLNGLTFYVPAPERTRVIVDGRPVSDLRCNPPDHRRRRSVSLPWPPLVFPDL